VQRILSADNNNDLIYSAHIVKEVLNWRHWQSPCGLCRWVAD